MQKTLITKQGSWVIAGRAGHVRAKLFRFHGFSYFSILHSNFFKLKHRHLLTAFIVPPTLFLSMIGLAQRPIGSPRGRVITADSLPASGVTIELKKLGPAVAAAENGVFVIKHLPPMPDTLIISSVGSKPFKQAVALKGGESADLGTIRLNGRVHRVII
jgi:hypothetical protein